MNSSALHAPAVDLAPLPKPMEEGIDGTADFYSAYNGGQMIEFRAAGIAATLAARGVVAPATAPWPDFNGNAIHHGDRLAHPNGDAFTAVRLEGQDSEGEAWRAVYDNATLSRLCLQIGNKGQAVVLPRPAIRQGKWMPFEPTPEIIAAAAVAVWPLPDGADIELARRAARIVLMAMDLAPGATVESVAVTIATMAPAYRAMILAHQESQ